eukprot:1158007-Pelagomonas_calceolata.AAC.4
MAVKDAQRRFLIALPQYRPLMWHAPSTRAGASASAAGAARGRPVLFGRCDAAGGGHQVPSVPCWQLMQASP